MKKEFKRVLSYIIDLLVVLLITSLICLIIPKENNLYKVQGSMNLLNEQILKKEINFSTYFNNYSILIHEIDGYNYINYIVTLIIIILYFIILPKLLKGQTIGMKLLKLRLIEKNKDEISLRTLIIRSLIFNGILYFIGLIILHLLFNDKIYFISVIILGIIQILLVITSCFMIIYRKDKRGLHDILSSSKVIEEVKL